jgi:hypothetical protein
MQDGPYGQFVHAMKTTVHAENPVMKSIKISSARKNNMLDKEYNETMV